MSTDWIERIAAAALSASREFPLKGAFAEVRDRLRNALAPDKPLARQLGRAYEEGCRAFVEGLESALEIDQPTPAQLRTMMEDDAFLEALAQLPFVPFRDVDTSRARELFVALELPGTDEVDFEAAWRALGRRFQTTAAASAELKSLLDLSMAAASEERSKPLAGKVDQLAARLSRLEQTLSPPTHADSQLHHELSPPSPFITRVRLKQYKSIAACDVALGPLTVLVGPNGSGKSNFLDALALISDALQSSLEQALRSRGGIGVVQHRSGRASGPVELAVEFHLTPELRGEYEFAVERELGGGFHLLHESCSIVPAQQSASDLKHHYRLEFGRIVDWKNREAPAVVADRLFLVQASGLPEFRPVFDTLSRMGVFNFNPDRILKITEPDRGDFLARDAKNLASVLRRLRSDDPETLERIETYLRGILPPLRRIETVTISGFETLEFVLEVEGRSQRFPMASISDGTLRALAILVAALGRESHGAGMFSLVGIEEPEKAIHPAATAALADAFFEASHTTQIIVTTHSPELLDHDVISAQNVVAVTADDGVTQLGKLDEFGISVLRDRLSTPGELLRQNHLQPEASVASGRGR